MALTTHISLPCCHFHPLSSKHLPQHPHVQPSQYMPFQRPEITTWPKLEHFCLSPASLGAITVTYSLLHTTLAVIGCFVSVFWWRKFPMCWDLNPVRPATTASDRVYVFLLEYLCFRSTRGYHQNALLINIFLSFPIHMGLAQAHMHKRCVMWMWKWGAGHTGGVSAPYKSHWSRDAPTVQHSTTVRSAHTVFMCFVFIWEQTATCVTYSLNWLVFVTEMKSVYSAVRTGSLNKAYRSRDAPTV